MRRNWTAAELLLLRKQYADTKTERIAASLGKNVRKVYAMASSLGLKKSAAFMATVNSGRIQRGRSNPAMVRTQFKPGQPAWNKGKHYMPGGRIRDGWFKPGQRSVRWDVDAYALGALRITTDGVLLIKWREGRDRDSWMVMARFVWWTETGHMPSRDEVVRTRNGDPSDTRIENLELLSRAENARRNSLWTKYPHEVARLFQLKGAIRRQVNRITKEATA